jgi:hypothetical protein
LYKRWRISALMIRKNNFSFSFDKKNVGNEVEID